MAVVVTGARDLVAQIRISRDPAFTLDVAMTIGAGRTVALLGPNGAGKSTVVDALAGLIPLDAGQITLGDTTLDDPAAGIFVPPERRALGVVFQDFALFPHLSVAANVAFGLRSRGIPRRTAETRARTWLQALALDALGDRAPGQLSGGEAQRVALARALASEPDALLLDEPLAALDVTVRIQMRRTLADHLARFPGPRLLITHDPTDAILLADEILVLEHGAIVQAGGADDIRLRPRTPYVADLAGSNLVIGTAASGVVTAGDHRLHIAETAPTGPVLATIHPRAISLHLDVPEGSPRNSWRTRIARLEHHGDRVRVQTHGPLPLTAEITPAAVRALDLREQSEVWISIKATEIHVEPR